MRTRPTVTTATLPVRRRGRKPPTGWRGTRDYTPICTAPQPNGGLAAVVNAQRSIRRLARAPLTTFGRVQRGSIPGRGRRMLHEPPRHPPVLSLDAAVSGTGSLTHAVIAGRPAGREWNISTHVRGQAPYSPLHFTAYLSQKNREIRSFFGWSTARRRRSQNSSAPPRRGRRLCRDGADPHPQEQGVPQALPDQVAPPPRGQDRLRPPQPPRRPGQAQVQLAKVPPRRPLHQPVRRPHSPPDRGARCAPPHSPPHGLRCER
jgi:hypothetical protein